VRPYRLLSSATAAAVAATCLGAVASADQARAQGKLDARYVATLAGLSIGRGAWVVEIKEDQFTAAASGATAGLMQVFSSGQGTGASRGAISSNGQLLPTAFASTVATSRRTADVRIQLQNGLVKDYAVLPPSPPDPDRVPLTDAHMKGVLDPMTGSLVRVPGTADPLSPEACQRSVQVFDGRMRYDLKVSFKRMEKVKSEKGYEGPVVVCAVNFVPIAGHDPDRAAIKYLTEQRDMETWLAPIAGTRFLAPYKIQVPTVIGLGVLQATQFITTRQPAATAKTL
jgi:hypothetical protein